MNFSPICQAVPGNVFDSNDTLLYNQSLIVYAPDNSLTRDLMEAVKGHTAFSVRRHNKIDYLAFHTYFESQEVGLILPVTSEDVIDALFEENNMLYAGIVFHDSESLENKVRH